MNLFRNLRADEIEVRISRELGNGKVELLLYKTARTDYNLLDETFGFYGWANQYQNINGVTYCGIAIKDPKTNTWIWRWNAGAEGNFEKEKSTASDSLKRAGFALGLGRELYSAPRIIVSCDNKYEKYSVQEINYDAKDRICDLVITDSKGNVVFNFHYGVQVKIPDIDPVEVLTAVCTELREEGESYKELGKFYKYYEKKIINFDTVNTAVIRKLWNKWNAS